MHQQAEATLPAKACTAREGTKVDEALRVKSAPYPPSTTSRRVDAFERAGHEAVQRVRMAGQDRRIRLDGGHKGLPQRRTTRAKHHCGLRSALAGLRIPGVEIRDPACVSKSWPDFFDSFEQW